MLKPVEKPIKFVKNLSTKGKSYPITHVSAVIDDNGESVKSTIDSLKNKASVTKVTWLELKNKRDAGKLIPGTLYRITDYQCTTTQENTKSAGHQFDIVLLALSENKLAEEGWAMMNESNVYDVTFSDGVTKKCWIYQDDVYDNIVDCNTLLGTGAMSIGEEDDNDVILNKTNRTAICTSQYSSLHEPGLTYNYFQNSNLSAWKVWYCLDNDKSRFAWADDSVDEGSPASIIFSDGDVEIIAIRNANQDTEDYYCWIKRGLENMPYYTEKEIPDVGDMVYQSDHGMIEETGKRVEVYNQPTQGTGLPNGRGVIYRLIDEWNIDYPCDFKNMQTLVPMDSNGNIAMENPVTSKYCYVFTDNTSGEPEDLSIKGHAINIKVEPRLLGEIHSAMYFTPSALFYTNVNNEGICIFGHINVGASQQIILVNRGFGVNVGSDSNLVLLKNCTYLSIGHYCRNIILDTIDSSTFGSKCENIMLSDDESLNYGNGGVELATKS